MPVFRTGVNIQFVVDVAADSPDEIIAPLVQDLIRHPEEWGFDQSEIQVTVYQAVDEEPDCFVDDGVLKDTP